MGTESRTIRSIRQDLTRSDAARSTSIARRQARHLKQYAPSPVDGELTGWKIGGAL